jgi:hypothetical protein
VFNEGLGFLELDGRWKDIILCFLCQLIHPAADADTRKHDLQWGWNQWKRSIGLDLCFSSLLSLFCSHLYKVSAYSINRGRA